MSNQPATATTAKAPEDEKWSKSIAKQLLKDDILSGRVKPTMKPKAVHQTRPEFLEWTLSKFRTNLKNLRDALARDHSRMLKDCEYYGHDATVLIEHRKKYPLKEIPWHLSEAKPLLEKDVDDGRHETMVPSVLHGTRPEYQFFTLETFRGHIYQEVKRREKMNSNIRYGKKKLRTRAEGPALDIIELIDKHDKDPPAPKKKAKKHGDEEPLKKQLKKEDLANLAEGRKAKVTRKEK